ncbi:MAG TPA: hypothetical protein VMS17_07400 [Gemmataceae bacterium]|nr:hypothetical protein [Gemmataceae bacterium]
MGFRVQLIAVTGKEPHAVQRAFGVSATGQREEIAESPVVGAAMLNGAYLLYINDPDRIVPQDEVFARLSKGASLVACYANETVMNSYACGWANGVERWSVFHDAQQKIKHLETSGTLPPEFQAIRDRLFAQQDADNGADFIFEIPVELFAAVGGIRYDQDIPGAGPDPWEILEKRE